MLAFRGFLVVLVLVIVWQLLVVLLSLPAYILPSPLQVAESMWRNRDLIFDNTLPTLIETILGLMLGIAVGMIIALLMVSFRIFRYWLLPIIIISQAIPTFAVAPVLVLWFGYGLYSKIITVIFMLFFPVASAFYDGLVRTNDEWLDMAEIMNGRKLRVLWHLRFPAALPSLAAGIRVATAFAPIGAIVSEWVGASKGLGFLMLNANAKLEIDLLFACLVTIMVISLLLYGLVNSFLKTWVVWR